MNIDVANKLNSVMRSLGGRVPLVYDTERVRPHIEWLIATPSMIDVNMIRTLVERIDHDVDYYTFESHEDYVLFWDAVIDWIFNLIEQQHPYMDWTELYQQTKNTIWY